MTLTKLGDYQIVRRIGQGGMGAVYEAVNENIGRRVAVKVLLPEYAHHADVVRRFFNEAKAVNAIKHAGVVQVSDVGTAADGSLYLVMEYLEGPTLSERLSESNGKLSDEETITISWQLAGVLAAAHNKSIVHRDLKPGNIMLVPDMAGPSGERVKLLDFGIAKLGAEHQQGEDVKTRTGQTLGTASYMSPEQFMGKQTIDAQTDVYSLGVVMYRMLAGRVPFISTNGEMALGMMHLSEEPPSLAELAPEVAEWLVKLVHRMLAKAATSRPTMVEVMNELQEHLPFRASSRSMPQVFSPNSGAHLRLNPVEPTAQQRPPAERKSDSAVRQVPLEGASAWSATPANKSSQSGAGTITRAAGQSALGGSLLTRRVPAYVAIGIASVIMGGGTGLYMLTRGNPSPPAASSVPVAPEGSNPAATASPAVSTGTAAQPGVEKSVSAAAAVSAPRKTGDDSAKKPGREKGARFSPSTKTAERKNDDKPRRAPRSNATPIID